MQYREQIDESCLPYWQIASLRKLVILVIIGHLDIVGKCEDCREFRVVGEVEPNDQWPY
jgi:hypothetical protein